MQLPSIQQITLESARTLKRFPFVLLSAALGTAAALLLAESDAQPEPAWAFRVLLSAVLGIPLLTGLSLFSEKLRWGGTRTLLLQACGIMLLAVYALTLPANLPLAPEMHIIRFFMLAVGLHLFVAFAPWLQRGQVNGFWHFNRTLFLRLLTSGLFTAVLWAGLAVALAAVENLFDVGIPDQRYFQLWVLLLGMFNTWFFLSGVPDNLDALDALEEYPKVLKVFTQYVLVPLVLIYLVILVSYTGKIILTWTWPDGWIARLILGFSAAGMFALLLLHPIREQEGNRWIRIVSRWFYAILGPLVVVYFLAVLRRLSDYGMTEGRYIAVVTGVWLGVMVLYFLFSRGKSIKAIPITLCIISLAISVGPWGAFAISENSQTARLSALLEKNDILADGKVHKTAKAVPHEDSREISAALQYLHDVHGYSEIEAWFSESLRGDPARDFSEWKTPSAITEGLGIQYVAMQRAQSPDELIFEAAPGDAMIVRGYERAFPPQYFNAGTATSNAAADDASYTMSLTLDTLTFAYTPAGRPAETLRVALTPVLDSLTAQYHNRSTVDVPLEYTALEASGNTVKVKVYTTMMRLEREDGKWKRTNMRVTVLYGAKDVAQ